MAALIEASRETGFPAEIVLVFSNVESAEGLAFRARRGRADHGVLAQGFRDACGVRRRARRGADAGGVALICEAGFMRIHSEGFVRKWEGRMLNIHPSLLPAFKGVKVHEQALAAGVKISGCTVHFMVPELDSGPIVAQAAVPVLEGDTPLTLAARVLAEEHRLYPAALRLVAQGKVRLEDGPRGLRLAVFLSSSIVYCGHREDRSIQDAAVLGGRRRWRSNRADGSWCACRGRKGRRWRSPRRGAPRRARVRRGGCSPIFTPRAC
ncbi:MAG: phosphoribosylglycinamide formyltransferase [Rhizomicrobium sp.]